MKESPFKGIWPAEAPKWGIAWALSFFGGGSGFSCLPGFVANPKRYGAGHLGLLLDCVKGKGQSM